MDLEEQIGQLRGRRKRYRVIFVRDKGICQIRYPECKVQVPFEDGTIDHIIPWSHGGTNDWDNMQLACQPCNAEKGSKYDCTCGLPSNAPGCRIGVEEAWEKYTHDLEWRRLYKEWLAGDIPKLRDGWRLPDG